MKLSRRIRDLLQATLRAPITIKKPQVSPSTKTRAHLDIQLKHIQTSIEESAARQRRLEEHLSQAEAESRERDVLRLQREIEDLSFSSQKLQATLDLIQTRIQMMAEAETSTDRPRESDLGEKVKATAQLATADDSEQTQDNSTDLEERRNRLSAPPK
jgi:hypothetical protein